MKELARSLRKNQTEAEKVLWNHLRNRQLSGYKFRRQHPIAPYIVDFFCPEKGIIIEVDGGQHTWQVNSDRVRAGYLESKGFRIIRFWNDQVLKDIDAVLEKIRLCLLEGRPPHPGPLPQLGERVKEGKGSISAKRGGRNISQATAPKKNQQGLTLFEILVTLLLTGIMLTGAAFIYRDFMDTWDQERSGLELQRQGAFALSVMEKAIKGSDRFEIKDYGGGTGNSIKVTVITSSGDAKDVNYYQDDTQNFHPIIEKKDTQEIIIIPDTYIEDGQIRSRLTVEDLKFRPESGGAGKSVRIDLKLKDTDDYGLIFDFTTSVRLRNKNLE